MFQKENELTRKGWVKKFTAGEPRLSESVELFKSLDFEVNLKPVGSTETNGECGECYPPNDKYMTIYTRKK